ncbi:uncharacterized protein HMPREF1541_00774 [Cyphellophora europaea CBS 101466]|uniref:Caffeine-induced death protein 2 n=1 Tax=Cyphellophora europaea (strain CBS 101466) TaxID=1220924 RepID=W2SEX6_CYPE1|nr:uncharacterized protein HMPREF1541_00774 [Cyphellophora europaea CBS 101466]ETN46588.1 hypothetical protein HMPREF1541_00774 [Cyphellophora europaea CBS 101466]
MSQPTQPPPLTPSLCFSTTHLRAFLRTSRSLIDDPINTSLNSLLTPSTPAFDPSSTHTRTGPSSHNLPATTCSPFLTSVIFPSWKARADVLRYCASVATSPDPDDPEAVSREVYNRRGQERVVDERLDPYSGRFFPREPRTEQLARVLREEEGVERIVRERTWGVVAARCEGVGEMGEGYEGVFARWRSEQEGRRP